MKKPIKISLSIILVVFCLVLSSCNTPKPKRDLVEVCFFVTDQNGIPVPDVTITFKEENIRLKTLIDGHSNVVSIPAKSPWKEGEDWFGTIVLLQAQGYVPIIIFNFVLTLNQKRTAEIMMLFDDGTLPYCAYVEIPSDQSIRQILL